MALSIPKVYALARGAGLTHDQAVTATAIAAAESGLRPGAVGDIALQTVTWGPSIGLWQIRSVRADKGTGRPRDASRLKDPVFNARSMASISSGGRNFGPWSTYTSGAYKSHLRAVRAAVGAGGGVDAVTAPSPTYPGGVENAGAYTLPLSPGDAAQLVTGGSIGQLALTGAAVGLGVLLVLVGLHAAVS